MNVMVHFNLSWMNGAESCHGSLEISVWGVLNQETAAQRATDQLRAWFKADIVSVVCEDMGEGK